MPALRPKANGFGSFFLNGWKYFYISTLDLSSAIYIQKAWRRPAPQWRPGGIADLRMLDAGITPKGKRIR